MKTTISLNKIFFFTSVIVFRLLLEVSYTQVISVNFEYAGYSFSLDIIQYIISWILYLLVWTLVPDRINRVSDYFFVMAFLALVAPLTILYGLDDARSVFPVITVVLALIGVFTITRLPIRFTTKLRFMRSGQTFVIVVSTIFVVFLFIWYYISGVVFNLDLTQVYEFRRDNAELSSEGILAYTNNWTFQIFNITLFILALKYKKYYVAALLFLIQVYFFAASAHKSVLFLPFIVLGIWFYFRKYNSSIVISLIFSFVILITLLLYYFVGDLMSSSLFSRRVFFVPSSLTYTYFEFFSNNPNVFWSNSILKSFIDYPYDTSVSYVIGGYLGYENMSANNGFISSGYANAGVWGVVLYVFLLGVLLKIIDEFVVLSMPLWIGLALTVIPLRNLLLSSDLLTVMLTHGFFIAFLFIYLLRRSKGAL